MQQPDNSILTHSPAYAVATVLSGLSTFIAVLDKQFALAIFLGSFTALLFLSRLGKVLSPRFTQKLNQFGTTSPTEESFESGTPRRLSIIIAVLTLAILWVAPDQSGIWVYSLPLMLMFFFEFKVALPILAVTSLLSIGLIAWHDSPFVSLQAVPNFILFLGASCALVYLRELRRRQLLPLRRTDNLSHAASLQHLNEDLQKEIQRSEREGSDLSVVSLKLDPTATEKLNDKEHDFVQVEIGKLLHNNLRIFDSYYRLEQHSFLIVLPHTSSKPAIKIADSLRLKIKQQIQLNKVNMTSSMGVSHLNVGDDCHSMVQHAHIAQDKALQRGGDQSYLFSDKDLNNSEQNNEN
ncbi:MAG: diguanylate cyclase [Oleiphilaceae bacterium]|nr:diguanylate cyclase [Oleiphilaceae bacterium]